MGFSESKTRILYKALDLFSVYGYEATSTGMIADSLGIKKSSLYSHFENKQDIFETLIALISEKYEENSVFARTDWDDIEACRKMFPCYSIEVVIERVEKHLDFVIHNDFIAKTRKMLIIEQFRNNQIAEIETKRAYTDVIKYHEGLMNFLIGENVLQDRDAKLMAAEYCLPISVWLSVIDREPEREEEIKTLIKQHIYHFYETYRR